MKRKYFIIIISFFIIVGYMYYNYTFVSPINVVDDILRNSHENNLLYELTPEQLDKINSFKKSSTDYGFPVIGFGNNLDWKLSKRNVMAKKRIWIKKNITLDKYIQYIGEHKKGIYDVDTMVDYVIYDPKMEQGYTPIGSYSGSIYFRLKKAGFNKWTVDEVTVLNPLMHQGDR